VQLVRKLPLQLPSQAEPSPAQAARLPRGAPVTAVHVPAVTSQASHCPAQALLQQTPSAQLPLVHWLPALQDKPLAFFGRQLDEAQ
jgi:hypothetical protein